MMNKNQLPDMIISGVSDAAGGSYDQVIIDGVGRIKGAVTSRVFRGNGNIHVMGDLAAEELDCNGTMNVRGNISFDTMRADGMFKVKGALRGERFNLNGLINIQGNCELEEFKGEGGFTIDGLLSAGHVDFQLQGSGKAREIGVESIVILQANIGVWSKLWSGIFPTFKPELVTGTIEGDHINLEYTTAEIVRGNTVIIGPGCKIGLVEYRSELSVHPASVIGKEEKIGG
ncbi:hypothetical protein [Paenibacillus wynnii]|uniref:hypothetical protein n=1 Tax=Paenibacillus wynnii TaxID=268407 RepID=UPI00278D7407|nr:hypothetical protein [Paenibacillus wynnii]MDQ0192892.1 cytoskeletal protein CcmA (bactofilin family) [Paenibacillus wynnii]